MVFNSNTGRHGEAAVGKMRFNDFGQPDEGTFPKHLLDTLVGYLGERTVSPVASALIGPPPGTPLNPKRWSFVTPTSTPVLVLETRTRPKESQLGEEQGGPSIQPSAERIWRAAELIGSFRP
jgi:hypothetical protein